MTRSGSGTGGARWVIEWVSIVLVGERQDCTCCAMRCVWGGAKMRTLGAVRRAEGRQSSRWATTWERLVGARTREKGVAAKGIKKGVVGAGNV
jgi:hypothetical protein